MTKFTKFSLVFILLIALVSMIGSSATQMGVRSAYGQQPYQYHFPMFFNQVPNPASTSYYVTTLNAKLLYNLGCELGTRDKNTYGAQDSVAVLAFGYPRCFDAGGYGANLYGYGPASTGNILTAVKQFALGYYTCTGSDNKSNLVIGVGTSNYKGPTEPCDTFSKAKAHGVAWSGMVRDLNQWAGDQGIFHQVQVYGANNIEVGWNTPAWARSWIAGFEQVSGNFMLHFGDAAGCPYEDKPYWGCGTSTYPEWTQEDVWYVSFGAPSALPLPLIYLTTGVHAKQWAYLSQYSLAQHGYRMDFTGVFSQWAYCQQFSWCYSTDNTPEEAYQQLTDELSKLPATAQSLRWKTDIRWIMQNEITSAGLSQDETQNEDTIHPVLERAADLESASQTVMLSPAFQTSLETKQSTYQTMAERIILSNNNPAPKDGSLFLHESETLDVAFISGIIENGEMVGIPYGVEITNVWQSLVTDGYLQVGAGTSPDDPQRGALYLVRSAPDQATFQSELIQAPEGCGPLTIIGYEENLLNIQSSNGCMFTLDLLTWNLIPNPH